MEEMKRDSWKMVSRFKSWALVLVCRGELMIKDSFFPTTSVTPIVQGDLRFFSHPLSVCFVIVIVPQSHVFSYTVKISLSLCFFLLFLFLSMGLFCFASNLFVYLLYCSIQDQYSSSSSSSFTTTTTGYLARLYLL